jgi:hypothetical protein
MLGGGVWFLLGFSGFADGKSWSGCGIWCGKDGQEDVIRFCSGWGGCQQQQQQQQQGQGQRQKQKQKQKQKKRGEPSAER